MSTDDELDDSRDEREERAAEKWEREHQDYIESTGDDGDGPEDDEELAGPFERHLSQVAGVIDDILGAGRR